MRDLNLKRNIYLKMSLESFVFAEQGTQLFEELKANEQENLNAKRWYEQKNFMKLKPTNDNRIIPDEFILRGIRLPSYEEAVLT